MQWPPRTRSGRAGVAPSQPHSNRDAGPVRSEHRTAELPHDRNVPSQLLSGTMRALIPPWSTAAPLRSVRAAVVVSGLFALSSKVIGNPQVATFAAFGGFATLVLASFGGDRRDKLVAHLHLAVAGSVVLVIGTAVHSTTWIAALVTVAVAFCVLFAGVASANAASGATALLLAYILPAASPGTIS